MCSINGPLRVPEPRPMSETEPLPIYLDYNATTPLCDEAWNAMCMVRDAWGNPSSTHPHGLAAKYYLEVARERVSNAIGARQPSCIIFTSGGTESNNLAIVGGATSCRQKYPERNVIVLSCYEHPAVEEVVKHLQSKEGFLLYRVAVDPISGVLEESIFREALHSVPGGPQRVALVTIMFANNEIGSVNPIKELCSTAKELCGEEVLFHTDAAQAIGKVEVNVSINEVDMLSICGHKFYAPKSSGALYIKDGVVIPSILYGAGHEKGLRPGTENVLFASAMAEAITVSTTSLCSEIEKMKSLRDLIATVLKTELAKFNMDYEVNGSTKTALPNTLNCAIFKRIPDAINGYPVTYISAARLIVNIGHQVCLSAGSACHAAVPGEELQVSLPLKAVGVHITRAIGTLRISTGRFLKVDEARRAATIIARQAAQQFADFHE